MEIRNPPATGAAGAFAACVASLAMLAACAPKTPPAAAEEAAAVEALPDDLPPLPSNESVVPAIIPPAEVADPTEPPSYEVAIASAAATHNKALERCKSQPKSVQTQCEQEANAAFMDAQAEVQNLRGDKE